jgi:hypothetical protein
MLNKNPLLFTHLYDQMNAKKNLITRLEHYLLYAGLMWCEIDVHSSYVRKNSATYIILFQVD